ncbi:MAG: hypothetical protein EOP48_22650 [Sphingobacteriales bacterium]|nr:MAG: hypothetical protein EOP48_22650 [Sphingobacteriales bacterium]
MTNGKWVNRNTETKYTNLNFLTGQERLIITGLMDEFDQAKQVDKAKARQILTALKVDTKSIEQMI